MSDLNPVRYRGYYYDTETGFYATGTRYYDPVTGRFINADRQLNPQDGILGFNMFSYCNNNPVNYSDPCGTCLHHLQFWKDCARCARMKNAYISPSLPLETRIKLSFAQATIPIVNTGTTITAVGSVAALALTPVAAGAPVAAAPVVAVKAKVATATTVAAPAAPKVVEKVSAVVQPVIQFSPNQNAVIQLAKESKAGLSMQDANTLFGWAKEYGISGHGPMSGHGYMWQDWHIKIKNIHIPIFPD